MNMPASLPKFCESGKLFTYWEIKKYLARTFEEAIAANEEPYEIVKIPRNLVLTEGATAILGIISGNGSHTLFDNTNARLGVGNASIAAIPTGTLTFTNGSAAVTGTGTAFTTEVSAGDMIRLDADDLFVEVLSVTNDTNLVLNDTYPGAGGTGAGSKVAVPAAGDTGLVGASQLYKGMEATYPLQSANLLQYRSIFTDTEANFRWLEATVDNGAGAGINMNRRLKDMGTKASGTWTLDMFINLQ